MLTYTHHIWGILKRQMDEPVRGVTSYETQAEPTANLAVRRFALLQRSDVLKLPHIVLHTPSNHHRTARGSTCVHSG